jgi:NAD(P)-dependent dehydrogenase (short-subunit alcohol dehydrogenase family)
MIRPMRRTALITGCSSGFGLEATVSLARRGWYVYATMRDAGRRDRLDARLADASLSGNVSVLALDVTDAGSIDRALRTVTDTQPGRIDALVNNAGVSAGGTFEDVPDSEVRRVLETNFFGVLGVTRGVLPIMRAQRHGRIVVISSAGAFFGVPGLSAYTASKWAIEGWAESVAFELAPFGISVVCVEPGGYATSIWESSPRHTPQDGDYASLARSVIRFVDDTAVPAARDPREVGEVVARALEARHPRFRYAVGPDARVQHVLKGLVPNRLVRTGVSRLIGLDR